MVQGDDHREPPQLAAPCSSRCCSACEGPEIRPESGGASRLGSAGWRPTLSTIYEGRAVAANRSGGLSAPRTADFDGLLDLIDDLLPRAVVIENVAGFATGRTSLVNHIRTAPHPIYVHTIPVAPHQSPPPRRPAAVPRQYLDRVRQGLRGLSGTGTRPQPAHTTVDYPDDVDLE